jgi:hypothetical protein
MQRDHRLTFWLLGTGLVLLMLGVWLLQRSVPPVSRIPARGLATQVR